MDRAHIKASKTSEILVDLVEALPNERVTIGDLLERLDGRSYGVLLLLLALPMCIPNIPGISTLFAVLMFVPAIQMVSRRDRVWLPKAICRWSFSRDALRAAVQSALPTLQRIEVLLKPRWCGLMGAGALPAWGLLTFVMALVLLLPLPFANFPVGVAMTAVALALLQQDGVVGVIGVVLAAATVVWTYFVIKTLGGFLREAADWVATLGTWLP